MTERTGLGPLELAVLRAIGDRTSWRRSSAVLADLESRQGIAPHYGYRVLADLLAPWQRHLLLVEGNGNFGTAGNDPPADAKYTEVRLSPLGRLALRAEDGQTGPVPFGLVDGTLYAGGLVPPFGPAAVLRALQDGLEDAGPPVLPSGGEVLGDLGPLLAGTKATLQMSAHLEHEPGALVVTGVGLGVNPDELLQNVSSRVLAWHREDRPRHRDHASVRPPAPQPRVMNDVRDETTMRTGLRLVFRLVDDADPVEAETYLRGFWPVTVEVDCRLPAPQAKRLRDWDRGDGSGLAALAPLLPTPWPT